MRDRPCTKIDEVNDTYHRVSTTTKPQITEACAQAAANLTSANAEFVRQALTAPETVAEVLEVLYLGGGGGGGSGADNRIGGGTRERGSKRAASCRQNSARVLRSICCGADASEVARCGRQALRYDADLVGYYSPDGVFWRSDARQQRQSYTWRQKFAKLEQIRLAQGEPCDRACDLPAIIMPPFWTKRQKSSMNREHRRHSLLKTRATFLPRTAPSLSRLVQLGFLLKLEQFFGQAESQNDEKAQELLAHSMWYMSVTLTDTKPPTPPPTPPTPAPSAVRGDDGSVPSKGGQQQQQQARRGRRRSSSTSVSVGGQVDATAARGTVGARGRRRSSIASNCVSVSAASEAKSARSHRGTTVIRASVVGGRGLIAPPNEGDCPYDRSAASSGPWYKYAFDLEIGHPRNIRTSSFPSAVVSEWASKSRAIRLT